MPILKRAEELSFQVVVHAIYDLDYLIISNHSACKPISMYLFIEKDTNRPENNSTYFRVFFKEKINFNLFLPLQVAS